MTRQVLMLTLAGVLSSGMIQAGPQDRRTPRNQPSDWETHAFDALDANRDGRISRAEWMDAFTVHDLNRDRELSPDEFLGVDSSSSSSPAASSAVTRQGRAYQAGLTRGQLDGRQAGVEDRLNNQPWDLDGQRELESADAGYTANLGSREDYRAGYREGFQQSYVLGFRNR